MPAGRNGQTHMDGMCDLRAPRVGGLRGLTPHADARYWSLPRRAFGLGQGSERSIERLTRAKIRRRGFGGEDAVVSPVIRTRTFLRRAMRPQRETRCDKFRRSDARRGWAVSAFLIVAGLALGGCGGVVGEWRLVRTKPEGSSFPVRGIGFDSEGRYASTGWYTSDGVYDGEEHTNNGDFTSRGNSVKLKADEGRGLKYKTRRRWDGKLVMTLEVPGEKRKVTAVFSRTDK